MQQHFHLRAASEKFYRYNVTDYRSQETTTTSLAASEVAQQFLSNNWKRAANFPLALVFFPKKA